MISSVPLISVIIPCRNEEKFIGKCLDSIFANDFPKNKIEVLIVDGDSYDGTRELIRKYLKDYPFIKLFNNSKKITPVGMNIGIKKSHGDHIIILSSHSKVNQNFIKTNVDSIERYNADCVGGKMVTIPSDNNICAQSITLALSHPFGVGNAYFRIGSKEPKLVDTVPFGCYKKEVFGKIGLFEEKLIRNQDIEFNLRLKRAGGKILLVPDIISYYHARSNLKDLFKQNFWNGFWVIYSSNFAEMPFSIRHLVPFMFLFSLLGSFILSFIYNPFIYLFIFIISIYTITNIFFSLLVTIKKNNIKYFPFLMASFLTLHFSYGLGSIWGAIKLALSNLK